MKRLLRVIPHIEKKIFIIHIYKNMGTTLYNQMSDSYKNKYYGQRNVDFYSSITVIPKNHSLDHLHIDQLLMMGILHHSDIATLNCISIIREPIARFISICNFENIAPSTLINVYRTRPERCNEDKQAPMITTALNWNITLFRMDDRAGIIRWFRERNKAVNLDHRSNVSMKKYSINDLTLKQLEYLNRIFIKDIELYNSIPVGGIHI